VATSTLGIGGSSLFTDGGDTTYLTSLTDAFAIGTTTPFRNTDELTVLASRNGETNIAVLNQDSGANAAATLRALTDGSTVGAQFGMGSEAYNFGGGALADRAFIYSHSDMSGINLYNASARPIIFTVNDVEAGRFAADSNFGIGTSSPNEKLTVDGNGLFTGVVLAATGTSATPSFAFSDNSGTGLFQEFADQIDFALGGIGRLTLDGANLYGSEALIVHNSGTAAEPTFSFTPDNDTGIFRAGADLLAFTTAGSEALRIDENGNVGIGTSSPSSQLDVWGDVRVGTSTKPTLFVDTSAEQVIIGSSTVPSYADNSNIFVSGGRATLGLNDLEIVETLSSTTAFSFPEDIKIIGQTAYILNRTGVEGLYTVDVSSPLDPIFIGFVGLDDPREIEIRGQYAYLTVEDTDEFVVVDISNPADMQVVSRIFLDAFEPRSMAVSGGYVYISDHDGIGSIVNISNPHAPIEVVVDADWGGTAPLLVSGNYLFAGTGFSAYTSFDISDPLNPVELGSVSTNIISNGIGADISGDYIYVLSASSDSLEIIDISDKANPVIVGNISETLPALLNDGSVDAAGGYVYVTTLNGLSIFNVSDPTNPVLVTTITDVSVTATKGAVSSNYYIAPDGSGVLSVIDLGGLRAPTANIGNLFTGTVQADLLQVHRSISTLGTLDVGGDAVFNQAVTIHGTASSSLFAQNSNSALLVQSGNVGIGTTTPSAKLSLESLTLDGTGVSGIDQYLQTENSVASAVQFGNRLFLNASNTATTTIVGSILRVADDTAFGNTVRGLEVQTNRGANTQGENTALSGFARTFGVRGVTSGDAGSSFEPAGGFFETEGTTQGNAVRGFSSSITSASLLSLFQDTSDFTGTGLEMNFGNTTGDFSSSSSKYLDFQNAGTSVFTVSAFGTTTIGDGTTNNMAGLQIGYGGICVDNDGTCTATTTGRITSVESQTGNSDLAEMYFSDQDLEPGEIVVLRDELSIRRATTDTDMPILGVVSTKPGLTLGFDDTSTRRGETGYPLALSGRVPVQLSNENGPIKAGDELMLSSLPGIAMKSDGTGITVGIALEDFNENRMYSDTYINQFGDDIATPDFTPITTNTDTRINDGCYYGGGSEAGEATCVPLEADTVDEQIAEANEIEAAEALEDALFDLQYVISDTEILEDGEVVSIGQIVMFVDRAQPTLSTDQLATLGALLSTSTITQAEVDEDEEVEPQTLLARLTELADGFVGGILRIVGIETEYVTTEEVTTETLCLGETCIDETELKSLIEGQVYHENIASSPVPAAVEEEEIQPEEAEVDDVENEEIETNVLDEGAATTTVTTEILVTEEIETESVVPLVDSEIIFSTSSDPVAEDDAGEIAASEVSTPPEQVVENGLIIIEEVEADQLVSESEEPIQTQEELVETEQVLAE